MGMVAMLEDSTVRLDAGWEHEVEELAANGRNALARMVPLPLAKARGPPQVALGF